MNSLSEAAEASSAPVRIGVAKPLGASSVLPEYQGKSQVCITRELLFLVVVWGGGEVGRGVVGGGEALVGI